MHAPRDFQTYAYRGLARRRTIASFPLEPIDARCVLAYGLPNDQMASFTRGIFHGAAIGTLMWVVIIGAYLRLSGAA